MLQHSTVSLALEVSSLANPQERAATCPDVMMSLPYDFPIAIHTTSIGAGCACSWTIVEAQVLSFLMKRDSAQHHIIQPLAIQKFDEGTLLVLPNAGSTVIPSWDLSEPGLLLSFVHQLFEGLSLGIRIAGLPSSHHERTHTSTFDEHQER